MISQRPVSPTVDIADIRLHPEAGDRGLGTRAHRSTANVGEVQLVLTFATAAPWVPAGIVHDYAPKRNGSTVGVLTWTWR